MRRAALCLLAGVGTAPAFAADAIPVGGGVTLRPLVDARLRWESVDQQGLAEEADAVTARLRAGLEAATGSGFTILAETEALLPIVADYNSGTNGRTAFPVVADPANIELNRLQLQYRPRRDVTVTVGRQRINIEDQRFVGSVGWRQNEQTFDAVRLEASRLGPFSLDLGYVWSVRTIYGITARDLPAGSANRPSIGGDNLLATLGVAAGPVQARAFAYLIDQDEPGRRLFSSQSYGVRATAIVPVGGVRLNLIASYARQSDHEGNPNDYRANYWLAEAGTSLAGFGLSAGYEVLGPGFQTPLATLHRFNGWADRFLVTPPNGLRDLYLGVSRTVLGAQASLVWHRFTSDRLNLDYGTEWNAQLAYRIRDVRLLLKYADYQAEAFATDTAKLWFQLEWSM